nr:hypothetical protein BaRGS_001423 [Batillaria attramentaria]
MTGQNESQEELNNIINNNNSNVSGRLVAIVIDDLVFRLKDMKNGWLTPCSETYKPVGGWPTLELDDLVYKTMADQLDHR